MDDFEIPEDYKPEKQLGEKEMDEITDYLKNHPLFIKEVPKDVDSNQYLSGLQNLIYDEDPDKLAESLNGNERLKEQPNQLYFMKDAYKKYTEGINVKCSNAATNAKLHCNRASINLKIKNYGKVIEDCKSALKFDPNYTKAYYRYACALQALKRYEECLVLIKDQKDPEFEVVRKQVIEQQNKDRKQKEQKELMASSFEERVKKYCAERGYKLKKRTQPLPNGVKLKFVDDRLCIPLIVMYPEFSQFDVVEHTYEEDSVAEHITQVIQGGLPWDAEHHYTPATVQAYVEVEEGVMLRLPPTATIQQVLKSCVNVEAVEVTLVSTLNKHYAQFRQQYKIKNM